MPESLERLWGRLEEAIRPGSFGRLLDRGLARSLIWSEGTLPQGAPRFTVELSEDLLDYGFSVLAMALRARAAGGGPDLDRAFLVAGEAIEAAVHRNLATTNTGFNRVCGAAAFHLARYSARAYSMLPPSEERLNLSPMETVLMQLLRRSLDNMRESYSAWLMDPDNSDEGIAESLSASEAVNEDDAIHRVLTTAFMRSIARFDHALVSGDSASAVEAREEMRLVVNAAGDLSAVNHWWAATLALHLIDELWDLSFHQRLPRNLLGSQDYNTWEALRRDYIQRLRFDRRSAIEFWPSQLGAVSRAVDVTDDLVVALPTSAGKTRIAELCILAALALGSRIYYVTPLRALSAQVERDLAETFAPLGVSVSSLYGAAGVQAGDAQTLSQGQIVVATPEKIDFALRNDPRLLDDVGLVVLDEGHMLGKNEREVRYEALVQRLLRRDDAARRRLVCLSAMFPSPEEMEDLVAWIRQDEPGGPIFSDWRPTRQRFGVVTWTGNAARLEVKVADETPFVPRFVEQRPPTRGSRRRRSFPADKKELTLATAWQFVRQGKDVLVYSPLRVSVEALGRQALKNIQQGLLDPLAEVTEGISAAMAVGEEWLGAEHPAVQCLRYGIALHHGGLPRAFLAALERVLKAGDCRLTIASPTLAQGLNLAASVLLVPSIWRNGEPVPAAEFANVTGRAGRAFVDMEGLLLHIIWPSDDRDRRRRESEWMNLVREARATRVQSGILQLALTLAWTLSESLGIELAELIEYVAGNSRAWDYNEGLAILEIDAPAWDRDIASLDAAILGLLDVRVSQQDLAEALDSVLEGSLFSRQLQDREEHEQRLVRDLVAVRAQRIWSDTTDSQRKGFAAAGIGLKAGRYINEHVSELLALLMDAETAVLDGYSEAAAAATREFARLVLETAPFRPPRGIPDGWQSALELWVKGAPAVDVIAACDDRGVDLLHEFLTYRLPWAMEAVRVHGMATEQPGSDSLQGLAALCVEVGSTTLPAILLLRHGLSSREAAAEAVGSTGADFTDRNGMRRWLQSTEIQSLQVEASWPTPGSHQAWLEFLERNSSERQREWERIQQTVGVEWRGVPASTGTEVTIEATSDSGWVYTLGYERLGSLAAPLSRSPQTIVGCRVVSPAAVEIEYFGPAVR